MVQLSLQSQNELVGKSSSSKLLNHKRAKRGLQAIADLFLSNHSTAKRSEPCYVQGFPV